MISIIKKIHAPNACVWVCVCEREFTSISLLRLFSRAHYWVNKYILKMRVSSKELFSTL